MVTVLIDITTCKGDVTASPRFGENNPTANAGTYRQENRPTSRASFGSVATVRRATHRFPFSFEENLKPAREERAPARVAVDRAGLPDGGQNYHRLAFKRQGATGLPPARALSLSSSPSLSRAHSLCLTQCLSLSLSPLSLSVLLRRKRCSLMLSARLGRGSVTWSQESERGREREKSVYVACV